MTFFRRHGIRPRLALLYTSIFGVTLSVFCAWLFHDFQRTQIQAFDTTLYNFAVDISTNLEMDFVGRLFVVNSAVAESGKLFPFHLGGSFLEIRDSTGRVLLHSRSLKDRNLPLDAATLKRVQKEKAIFQNIRASNLGVESTSPDLRLLSYWTHHSDWREPLILQIAVPLDLPNQERRDLLWFFAIGIPVCLVFAAASGIWLSKLALHPVHQMTLNARDISGVDNLKTRILVPQADDEIRELAETFNGLLDRLDKAFTSQERFISNASHQLKTPLTILQGELELLQKSHVQNAQLSQDLSSIGDEIKRLIHLVQDLLLLARLEAGSDTITFERVPLDDVLMKVVSRLQKLARNKNVKICTQLTAEQEGSELDVAVSGDEELIDSMLENFIENAVKYAPADSQIDLQMRSYPHGVEVKVRDHGIGISKDLESKVFERFTRGEPSNIIPGSGLGLSIAAEIARLHGVKVDLRSEGLGHGTTVTLTFPQRIEASV